MTTCSDVTKRLEQWRRKCGHAVEAVYSKAVRVNHAYRVEAMVQAELRDVRLREVGCHGCGGNHIEWFKERVKHAEAVIEKYGGWMDTNPYVCGVGGEETAGWLLKPDEKIEDLCHPLERKEEELKTRKKPSEKRKSGNVRR